MAGDSQHPLGVPGGAGAGTADAREESGRRPSGVNALDRWLARRIMAEAGSPPLRFALWDGQDVWSPGAEAAGRIVVRDRGALWAIVRAPELGFGDCYSAGRIEIEGNLIDVLYRAYRAMDGKAESAFKKSILGRLPRAGKNTLGGSRKHIHHHYDLGNDFYRLWLDERMVYTCAYYENGEATLEEAQEAKMHHVCRKVRLRPGQRVVEAGCGWGSLALHMARHYGVKVRAFNISYEQVAYARERAAREGLGGQVEFVEDDYRNISGEYDAFVSVGMLEHVGPDHYETLGDVIARSLKEDGLGIVHSVGRSRPSAVNAWLEQRIFPGKLSAEPARDDVDLRGEPVLDRRHREPAPALCEDPEGVARTLRRQRRHRAPVVRRSLRARLAPVPGGLRGRLSLQQHPALPGGVHPPLPQPHRAHPRAHLPSGRERRRLEIRMSALPHYDAIVVGGGPAGSSAAARLVEGGAKVAVLDREDFPAPSSARDGSPRRRWRTSRSTPPTTRAASSPSSRSWPTSRDSPSS